MLRHLGRSPPRRTTDDVPDHQMTRGDGHVLAGGHDALEDLDLMSRLILVLIMRGQFLSEQTLPF